MIKGAKKPLDFKKGDIAYVIRMGNYSQDRYFRKVKVTDVIPNYIYFIDFMTKEAGVDGLDTSRLFNEYFLARDYWIETVLRREIGRAEIRIREAESVIDELMSVTELPGPQYGSAA